MKVKIVNTHNSVGTWGDVIGALLAIGCVSRDGDYDYTPEKASVVVENGQYILKSRTDYRPKKNPYAQVMCAEDFLALSDEQKRKFLNGKAVSAGCKTKADVEVAFIDGVIEGMSAITCSDPEPTPCDQSTLVVKKADVLVQNSIIFRTQTIPYLRDNGVDVTEDDGKYYLLDLENNESVELTPEYVKTKAEEDLVNGEDTVWTKLVTKFDLINELKMTKKVEKDS